MLRILSGVVSVSFCDPRLWRELLADKPRVTKYPVDFDPPSSSATEDVIMTAGEQDGQEMEN